jgi:hypothetical protein
MVVSHFGVANTGQDFPAGLGKKETGENFLPNRPLVLYEAELSAPYQHLQCENLKVLKIKCDILEGVSYPVKQDDFFPYADIANGYWTG